MEYRFLSASRSVWLGIEDTVGNAVDLCQSELSVKMNALANCGWVIRGSPQTNIVPVIEVDGRSYLFGDIVVVTQVIMSRDTEGGKNAGAG